MRNQVLALAIASALAGCALEPTSVGVTAEHDSHLLQHIGPNRTDHGRNAVGIEADWQLAPRVTLSIGESYSLKGKDGCLDCPREAFAAQVRYDIWHK